MLVASQVLLSVVLPTVMFPLIYLCSKEEVMTVYGPKGDTPVHASRRISEINGSLPDIGGRAMTVKMPQAKRTEDREKVSFTTHRFITWFGCFMGKKDRSGIPSVSHFSLFLGSGNDSNQNPMIVVVPDPQANGGGSDCLVRGIRLWGRVMTTILSSCKRVSAERT